MIFKDSLYKSRYLQKVFWVASQKKARNNILDVFPTLYCFSDKTSEISINLLESDVTPYMTLCVHTALNRALSCILSNNLLWQSNPLDFITFYLEGEKMQIVVGSRDSQLAMMQTRLVKCGDWIFV